eukprot:CAMPEP_0181500302 /NCGR_PEP_ID=MMETSP1110-20121109/55145_1 /TAXON_ID=174948 /ORGANISM="Symbiodinium sp., Strain CCMP421" /LENGTH=71 /DNA_ID=CAMNT_0023628597 /DNA_START=222 /DNA_END=437 /DNA_ORIENTATION=+
MVEMPCLINSKPVQLGDVVTQHQIEDCIQGSSSAIRPLHFCARIMSPPEETAFRKQRLQLQPLHQLPNVNL